MRAMPASCVCEGICKHNCHTCVYLAFIKMVFFALNNKNITIWMFLTLYWKRYQRVPTFFFVFSLLNSSNKLFFPSQKVNLQVIILWLLTSSMFIFLYLINVICLILLFIQKFVSTSCIYRNIYCPYQDC